MSTETHTPTPWYHANGTEITNGLARYDSRGVLIGNFIPDRICKIEYPCPMLDDGGREANAAYIVKCVNSHDMLVEALREMTAAYEEMHGPCSLVLDARKALATVEGGEA